MKILTKLSNKLPICLLNKKFIDLDSISTSVVYPTLSSLPEYFIPLDNSGIGYNCFMRGNNITMLKGVLYNHNGIIMVVYKDTTDHQFKAYISLSYITEHPSHKVLLNKFAKFYGVNIRKDVAIIFKSSINKFFKTWTPSMKDYDQEEQLKQSKNFLNYKKWQTPLMTG